MAGMALACYINILARLWACGEFLWSVVASGGLCMHLHMCSQLPCGFMSNVLHCSQLFIFRKCLLPPKEVIATYTQTNVCKCFCFCVHFVHYTIQLSQG